MKRPYVHKPIGKRDAQEIERLLTEARYATKMEHAHFGDFQSPVTLSTPEEIDQFIKSKVRLYVASYIEKPLNDALDKLQEHKCN